MKVTVYMNSSTEIVYELGVDDCTGIELIHDKRVLSVKYSDPSRNLMVIGAAMIVEYA